MIATSNAQSNPNLNLYNIGEFHNLQMKNYFKSLQRMVEEEGLKQIKKEHFFSAFNDLSRNVFGNQNQGLVELTNN